ncbi:MAG TPA: phospholipase D-like domain-containing protein [Chloroflexota bacterium]|nr:phospholipase D-like domain-containing protein [Chloroflexota bacterium]HUM71155.1 phospholipase D-like domain-containing protein [Chloroflexota bacterium]
MRKVLLVLILLLFTAVACDDLLPDIDSPPIVDSGSGEWYEIYFTNPTCPPENQRQGGLDEIIAADLLEAELQVDVAAFDFDAPPMIDALIELGQRGVTVRVVTDTDNASQNSINRLRRNGISVVEDKRSALMHNKFIVIDGRYTWMGSTNFTTNDIYCYNNNLVRIDSPQLAANYRAEMDEMYNDRKFGPTSPATTPNEQFTIGGVRVENYFASETKVAPIIGRLVEQAQNDIKFMAFSFTHEDIGEAMIDRAQAGVNVQGVFETTGSQTEFSYYGDMLSERLPNLQVRQDGNPRLMHHKVIIIDGRTTIFGSFNFTGNANNNNDENVLIVHDPTFASYFLAEFQAVWNEARQP